MPARDDRRRRAVVRGGEAVPHRQPSPKLEASVEPAAVRAGEDVRIVVRADADARWIAARLFGASPVRVAWDGEAKANVGRLHVPEGLPAGVYTVRITGEDLARNAAVTEVQLEVLGR